jgi:hypothetical protein
MTWSIDGIVNDKDGSMAWKWRIISNSMKGVEKSHFTSFHVPWCWLYIIIEEDDRFIRYCICWRLIYWMWITAYFRPFALLRAGSLVRFIQLYIGFNMGFIWRGLIAMQWS